MKNQFMIAGTHSGCGKTTVTCAVLQALVNRGIAVSSFKCGPDYIDPMFHSKIIGAPSHNLDGFFCPPSTIRALLRRYGRETAVIEGVMGFYDGVGDAGSAHRLALDTGTPAVIVIDCKGMGQSVGAVMQGFLQFRQPNAIAGFLFNRLPDSMVTTARLLCEKMRVAYLGRLPYDPSLSFSSRHLGLVTAGEIENLKDTVQRLAELAEANIDLDALLQLHATNQTEPSSPFPSLTDYHTRVRPKIAVARDEAFCFYYSENLDLLRDMGCELIPFSPLTDRKLPEGISGLLLGGGYPELHAKALSENTAMRDEIRRRIAEGLPTVAECGGFLYLQEQLEDGNGINYPMVGAVAGKGFRTPKLRRFGYVTLTAKRDNLLCRRGESLPAHEFHYWDSDSTGDGFSARRASSGQRYDCVHATGSLYAGFPHLYFCASPVIAEKFVRKCEEFALS